MKATIEHAALYVTDLDAARAFFEKYFDATAGALYENGRTHFRSYFLNFANGARLEIMTRPETVPVERDPYATGWAHLAFSLGSREAVDELTRRLQEDGYQVLSGPRVTGDGYYESVVSAIDGCQLELTT